MLLTFALQRMREDIHFVEVQEAEASQVEERQRVANYKKMSMLAAKSDLDSLLVASKGGLSEAKRKADELGESCIVGQHRYLRT